MVTDWFQKFYLPKMEKWASKSETERLGIVGRFQSFEENAN